MLSIQKLVEHKQAPEKLLKSHTSIRVWNIQNDMQFKADSMKNQALHKIFENNFSIRSDKRCSHDKEFAGYCTTELAGVSAALINR